MKIERSDDRELTPEEVQHLEKLKAVVKTALTDGILDDNEMAQIKSLILADKKVTYEGLRTFHATLRDVMGDELPHFDWHPN